MAAEFNSADGSSGRVKVSRTHSVLTDRMGYHQLDFDLIDDRVQR